MRHVFPVSHPELVAAKQLSFYALISYSSHSSYFLISENDWHESCFFRIDYRTVRQSLPASSILFYVMASMWTLWTFPRHSHSSLRSLPPLDSQSLELLLEKSCKNYTLLPGSQLVSLAGRRLKTNELHQYVLINLVIWII